MAAMLKKKQPLLISFCALTNIITVLLVKIKAATSKGNEEIHLSMVCDHHHDHLLLYFIKKIP